MLSFTRKKWTGFWGRSISAVSQASLSKDTVQDDIGCLIVCDFWNGGSSLEREVAVRGLHTTVGEELEHYNFFALIVSVCYEPFVFV